MDPSDSNREVDRFFADAEKEGASPFNSRDDYWDGTHHGNTFSPFIAELLTQRSDKLGKEEYSKFAAAVAADERIKPYLPLLAIEAIGKDFYGGQREQTIDTDKNNQISKTELIAGSKNSQSFDAVYRAALEHAATNFEAYRNWDPHDGNFSFMGLGSGRTNSRNITSTDVNVATRTAYDYYEVLLPRIGINRLIRENFADIDADKSGLITGSEGQAWLHRNFRDRLYPNKRDIALEIMCEALPQRNIFKEPSDYESLSRQSYDQRIQSLKEQEKRTAKRLLFRS